MLSKDHYSHSNEPYILSHALYLNTFLSLHISSLSLRISLLFGTRNHLYACTEMSADFFSPSTLQKTGRQVSATLPLLFCNVPLFLFVLGIICRRGMK